MRADSIDSMQTMKGSLTTIVQCSTHIERKRIQLLQESKQKYKQIANDAEWECG